MVGGNLPTGSFSLTASTVREQILETSTRLIAARGFGATSLQAIADEVGIRKPSILYHFANKDELRQGVLDRLLSHWNEVLPRLLMATARDGAERFQALMGELMAFFAADRDRARLLIRELLDRPTEMRAYLGGFVRPWIDMVADLIRRAQVRGQVPAGVDAEAYVVQVIALTLGSLSTLHETSVLIDPTDPESAQSRGRAELVRIASVALFGEEPTPDSAPDLPKES